MRLLKSSLILIFVTILLAGCLDKIDIPIGDGNKLNFSGDGITIKDEDGVEGTFGFSEEEGISFSGDGEDGQHVAMGQNLSLPDDWPAEIPVLDDANITHVETNGNDKAIYFNTATPFADVVDLYTDHMNSNFYVEPPHVEEHAFGVDTVQLSGDTGSTFVRVTIQDLSSESESMSMVQILMAEHDDEQFDE